MRYILYGALIDVKTKVVLVSNYDPIRVRYFAERGKFSDPAVLQCFQGLLILNTVH